MSKYDKTKKLIINRPLNWTALNLSKEAKSLVFETDEEGNIKAFPIISIDPTQASPSSRMLVNIADPTLTTQQANVNNMSGAYTITQPVPIMALVTASAQYYLNVVSNALDAVRTPSVWKSALISAAGSTAIWTSGVGKKWRLMGIRITLVNGTTAAAASLLKMLDVAADTGIGVQICGAAMGAVGSSTIIVNENYGNGYLAAATNTALNVNLSSVLAVAGVFVQVWGTEE